MIRASFREREIAVESIKHTRSLRYFAIARLRRPRLRLLFKRPLTNFPQELLAECVVFSATRTNVRAISLTFFSLVSDNTNIVLVKNSEIIMKY